MRGVIRDPVLVAIGASDLAQRVEDGMAMRGWFDRVFPIIPAQPMTDTSALTLAIAGVAGVEPLTTGLEDSRMAPDQKPTTPTNKPATPPGQTKLHTVTFPDGRASVQVTQEQWQNRKSDPTLQGGVREDADDGTDATENATGTTPVDPTKT